jgi:hypothetical protein
MISDSERGRRIYMPTGWYRKNEVFFIYNKMLKLDESNIEDLNYVQHYMLRN